MAYSSELRLFGRADYKVKTLHRLSPSSLSAARLGLSREKLRRTATAEKRSICPSGLSFMHGDIREPVAGEDQSMPETQESKHKFDPYFLCGPRISRPAVGLIAWSFEFEIHVAFREFMHGALNTKG